MERISHNSNVGDIDSLNYEHFHLEKKNLIKLCKNCMQINSY